MGDSRYPDVIVNINVDQRVREPAQRAVSRPGFILGRVQLWILTDALQRGLELLAKLPTQTGASLLVMLQRLTEFGLGIRMEDEGLHG